MGRRDMAAGAGHAGRHDFRIAGNEPAEMTRDQPRIGIGLAAGPRADDERDGFALVEFRHVLRRNRVHRAEHNDASRDCKSKA